MANQTHGKGDWRPKEQASGVAEAAEHMAGSMAEKASGMAEKATEAGKAALKTAGNVASQVGKRADDLASAAGGTMESFGSTVRDYSPKSGVLGNAGSRMAEGLESTGHYLKEHGFSGIAEDIANVVRRNPVPALLVGIGIGFLLARATRR